MTPSEDLLAGSQFGEELVENFEILIIFAAMIGIYMDRVCIESNKSNNNHFA